MTPFRAAAVQITGTPLDMEQNAARIERHVRRAADDGAKAGSSGGLAFCGNSTIVDPHGERKAVLVEGEGRVLAHLDPAVVLQARTAIPYLRDLHRIAAPRG